MSKIFDAVRQAELAVAERKQSGTAATPVVEGTPAQTGASGQGSQPKFLQPSPNNALAGMLGVMPRLIRRAWPRRKAPRQGPPQTSSAFGDLGSSLESAQKSALWQRFHLEQTREENGTHRFQSNEPELHSFCYLDVAVSAKNQTKALTLAVQRAFISGVGEPLSRDLVRSFLCVVFPEQKSEAVSQLINELAITELGGLRPVDGATKVRPAPPSAPYLVFVGQGKRGAVESGPFVLEAENVSEESTPWFRLHVKPRPFA